MKLKLIIESNEDLVSHEDLLDTYCLLAYEKRKSDVMIVIPYVY